VFPPSGQLPQLESTEFSLPTQAGAIALRPKGGGLHMRVRINGQDILLSWDEFVAALTQLLIFFAMSLPVPIKSSGY